MCNYSVVLPSQESIKRKIEDSMNVYKYRRRESRPGVTIPAVGIKRDSSDMGTRKTYAVLQETRPQLTDNKIRKFLIIYSNPGWKLVTSLALVLAFFLDTFMYTFIEPEDRCFWLIIPIICLNLIFTLDVAIVVSLKISNKWRRTLNLVEMDTSRVIFDVLLAVPYSMLYLFHFSSSPETHTSNVCDFQAIAPAVATLRIYRILEHFYNKSSQAGSNKWSSFLVQYLILFVISVHTWTCIWYLFSYRRFNLQKLRESWSVSAVNLPTDNTFDWYCVCAYWSVMMLTTNALGDLYPVSTIERIVATLAILLGFTLTTIVFVGSLTSQFITLTTRRSKYVRQLKKIKKHLSLIKMDAETTKRIIRYYEDLWYQKSGVFNPELLLMLPSPLQMEICYDLNAVPLYCSLVFRKLPEAFLRRLSVVMAHRFYLPGDIIYDHNQHRTFMVCVTNGVVELLSDEDDESPMISFTKGTCFGEISLVYNIPARCTVKAATYVECQVLQKTKFIRLMITYPDLLDQIRKEIQDRIERSRAGQLKKNKDTALKLNIYVSKDKKKSSIKCLKEKLRYIQGKTDVDTVTKKDELDQNCLDLYIIADHVRKKTKLFTCINKSFPWLLEADCLLVKYWELYMLLVVFYVATVLPYHIAYSWMMPDQSFTFIQVALNITLVVNMLITCTTAVKTKKKYINDFWGIVDYRMNTTGFYMDMIAIVPMEFLVTIYSPSLYTNILRKHLFFIAKGLKLTLVWRLSNYFEKLEAKLLLNSLMVKVSKYCIYILLICYWSGLVLFMEACFETRCSQHSWIVKIFETEAQEKQEIGSRIQYPLLTSVYFATSVLLSVGFGDFSPGDKYDMGFVAFLSLFGVVFSGYAISEFSSVVTHYSRTKTAFLEVVITIDKFMRENSMHETIKNRIMAFYELQWQYNSGVELTDDCWLEKNIVPAELRKKVLHQARFKAITSIGFFQVKNKAYIHTLTETSKDIILPPQEIIYYGGTITRDLYIIESGYCLVTSEEMRQNKKERIIGPGNHLGLLVLLYGVPAVSTVITLTHCKLISISYSAYNSALSLFPDMREHDGLLTQAELKQIENQAKTLSEGADLKYYKGLASTPKAKITSIVQEFINESFINVLEDYRLRKQSYWKSYKQFNFMTNIVPYLLIPIVIKPDGLFLRTWTILRVGVAFLISLIIPIATAMAPTATAFDEIIIILELVCYVDLYLKLHIAYYGPKNQLVYHPYLTAKYYLTRAFLLDLVTCFPWYLVNRLFRPTHTEGHLESLSRHYTHCIIRMASILQIYKLHIAFWIDSMSALKRVYLTNVLQFMLLTIFYLNLYACVLITMTCRYVHATDPVDLKRKIGNLSLSGPYRDTEFNRSGSMICQLGSWIDKCNFVKDPHIQPIQVYLLALYWAVASFSAAGFGDITAQSTKHMILAVIIMMHGVLFFGFVYARIASLKAMADQVTTKFLENLKQLDLFMTREKVNLTLRKTIMDYWKYQWKRTGGWSHQTILGKLHANLNEDAVLYMYEKTLREIPLFENVENTFFRAFAKQLVERYYQKGYMVTKANEVMNSMHIIYRGKVDVISDAKELEACMGPGGIFGNIRGETKYLTQSNIVASRNIDLLSIDGAEFYALLKSYPTVYRKVMFSVSTTVKDYVLPSLMAKRMSFGLPQSMPLTCEDDELSNSDDDMYHNYFINSPSGRSLSESQGSKSIMSCYNSQYVSAPLLMILPHKWFRSSVLPDSKWVIFMEYFILVLSYWEFMMLLYEMAFMSNPYYIYTSAMTDVIFLYKLFLDLHTSYMNRYGDYVFEPKKVRKVYFSKTYLRRRDFLANLPICYLALALNLRPGTQMAFFIYLRTPQLFRITYLLTYQTHRKINIGSANLFVKLATIILWVSILTHLSACLFFKLSCLTPVQCTTSNWMTKADLQLSSKYAEEHYISLYIASLWYVMNLLTIAGTGDVSSQNNLEVIETILLVVIIKFCTGLLISEMSAMIGAHSASLIAYDYNINELRDGLKYMDLSDHQMNKMWDYVKELWTRQQGRQMPELIFQLPYRLRCLIMQAVYGNHIRDSVIFSKTEEDFKRMLCMWLSHCVFFPGNYIVQCGDSDQCLYFIHRGEVEVLTVHANMTESIYDILGPEDSFGVAQGLFVGVPHHFSFRARTVVDIVYLKLDQWKYLLDFYPKSARIVHHKVENVYLSI